MSPTPEEEINAMIDAKPVIDNPAVLDMSDATRSRLMQDIAYGLYPMEEVAKRYGLGNVAGLKLWMRMNPECVARIKALRAIHSSDDNKEKVNRLKANCIIEESLPSASGIIMNPQNPLAQRIDMFKAIQKMAGLDSAPAANKEAAAGATFSLNINFGDRVEKINATVVKEIDGVAEAPEEPLPEEDA